MRWILLGPPGSGKGTQASNIIDEFKIPYLSTGDIFREAMSQGTELGLKAKDFIDKGNLVPDYIVVGIVKEKLDTIGSDFLLDGFPRTVVQAENLDKYLDDNNLNLDGVLLIDVKDETIIDRLGNRWVCDKCGANRKPNSNEEKCSKCGGTFIKRTDDKIDTIKNRLNVYKDETSPLIDYYKNKGILKVINGEDSPENIYINIKKYF